MKRPNSSTGIVAAQVTVPPVVRGRITRVASPYWAAVAIATGFLFSAGRGVGHAQGGISTEGPFTVFRTGTNEPLLTLSLPLSAASSNSPSLLRFDFGFATSEPDLPNRFFDSFSVTLQRNDQSATTLLLTADRTGVQWTPTNPGGLTIEPASVQHTNVSFPDLNPAHLLRFAYSVTFVLPTLLSGGPLMLFFDLFDNLNQAGSLAFTSNARVETATPTVPVKLFSAPAATGIYSEEINAILDEVNFSFSLSKPSDNRFYRIQAERLTRIISLRVEGVELAIEYRFEDAGSLSLQSAGIVTGPFVTDTNAVWDPISRTFTLPKGLANSFFRIAGERTTRVAGIRESGNQVVVEYQLVQTSLHSASTVNGLYSAETAVVLNETNRTFTISRPGGNRFYRLTSDVPSRLRPPRLVGAQLILEYELNP